MVPLLGLRALVECQYADTTSLSIYISISIYTSLSIYLYICTHHQRTLLFCASLRALSANPVYCCTVTRFSSVLPRATTPCHSSVLHEVLAARHWSVQHIYVRHYRLTRKHGLDHLRIAFHQEFAECAQLCALLVLAKGRVCITIYGIVGIGALNGAFGREQRASLICDIDREQILI